jgi:CSLREA domain-containing protein
LSKLRHVGVVVRGSAESGVGVRRAHVAPRKTGLFAATIALAIAIGMPVRTRAASFTVDSTMDLVDANPGDGVCSAGPSGPCTLRAAIQESNALPGDDDVILPAGTYVLTIPGADEDDGATGDLDVGDAVSVFGAGRDVTIVDGNGLDSVFDFHASGTLLDMTVRKGNPAGIRGAESGIDTVSLERVSVRENEGDGVNVLVLTADELTAESNSHVGVAAGFGVLTNLVVRGNNDAGVCFLRRMAITDGTIEDNGDIGVGACWNTLPRLFFRRNALQAVVASAELTRCTVSGHNLGVGTAPDLSVALVDSTVTGNMIGLSFPLDSGGFINYSTVASNGIGMRVDNCAGVTVENSTFSDNTGLAIDHVQFRDCGGITITNATIAGNGGGISTAAHTLHSPLVSNSIIAGNGTAADCLGNIHADANLIQDATGCTISDGTNVTGVDPLLGPLQANGGPTATRALLPGSPAIDAGSCVVDVDQRGIARPVGRSCDLGAYESACGDGVQDPGEACDDGPSNGTDRCCNACVLVDQDRNGICDAKENCLNGPDLDGDGIANACDQKDAPMTITSARIRRSHDGGRPDGSVALRGTFSTALAGDSFSATKGLAIRVTDGGSFDMPLGWTTGECATIRRQTHCQSRGGRWRASIAQVESSGQLFKFLLWFGELDVASPLAGPVAVDIAQGALVAGIDRVGSIASCVSTDGGVACVARGAALRASRRRHRHR